MWKNCSTKSKTICLWCLQRLDASCLGIAYVSKIKSCQPQSWTCHKCVLSKLPFYGHDILETSFDNSTLLDDDNCQDDAHLNILKNNAHLKIIHINTQSMVSTFDHLCLIIERYSFDVITMSETWLKENNLLLQHVAIPGYVHAFNNRDRLRGGGVDIYIKESIKFKRRYDIEKR